MRSADITNFETLKKVADDIHSRAAELGFDAFSSAGLEGSSSWRFSGHLANMPLFYEFRDDKRHLSARHHQGHLSGQLQERLGSVHH